MQSVFPNVETIFRIFLTLMISNCSGERSFSRLKRVKNECRASMLQRKLCSLSILYIESDKLRTLSFEDIVTDFAIRKARKRMF